MSDQTRIGSRGFWALWIAVAVLWLLAQLLMPVFGGPGSGKGGAARADMMKLAFAFDEELSQTNGFSVDRIVVRLKALHTGSSRTNALGEFIDVWGVGYKTVVQNRTNVLIRCAGPNRKFGDNDDIAYDSLSKKFLK